MERKALRKALRNGGFFMGVYKTLIKSQENNWIIFD